MKKRFTEEQIIGFLREADAGMAVKELCRRHGISSATFYKWRSKFGGMDASMMARFKELEDENRRLKKMSAEAQMSADILKEALQKNGKALSAPRDGRVGSEHPRRGVRFSGLTCAESAG